MDFKIKNYTTGVSAEKSIFEIEQMLSLFGATHLMKELAGDGKTRIVGFRIGDKNFKLPANYEGVYKIMFGNLRDSGKKNCIKNREDQAYRITWRIIRDWLHAQLSLISSGQAQPDEIMLPYMFDGKRTLYQRYKDGVLQLEDKSEE